MTAFLPYGVGHRSSAGLLAVPAALVYLVALVLPMLLLAIRSLRSGAGGFTVANYARFASDPFYWRVLADTLWLATLVTILCVAIGWPIAFLMVQASRKGRVVMTIVIIAPLLISVVVRTFGWVVLLGNGGVVDEVLSRLGTSSGGLLYTRSAVVIGMVHIMLPMLIVSVAASLGSIEPVLFRAALNLGASPVGAIWRVLLPLSAPGLLAGAVLVFGVTASAFVTPAVLGGATLRFMSTLIYQDAMITLDFGRGGALAIVLLVTTLVSVAALSIIVERVLVPGVFRSRSA